MLKDIILIIEQINIIDKIKRCNDEYRKKFEISKVDDNMIYYKQTGWGLSWRVKDMFTKYSVYIYNFRTIEQQGVLPRNYF